MIARHFGFIYHVATTQLKEELLSRMSNTFYDKMVHGMTQWIDNAKDNVASEGWFVFKKPLD